MQVLLILLDNTTNNYHILSLTLPHIAMAAIAFAGVCTTIYYSTNQDVIHVIIAMCVCIFLYTMFINNPIQSIPAYIIGACIGYTLYRKKQ